MEKIRSKHPSFLLVFGLLSTIVFSQSKSGIENYNLLSRSEVYVWMPIVHYQFSKGFYTELRYNYEDVQTLSLYAGKTYAGGKALNYTVTPMIGFSKGKFTGFSIAANFDAEWKSLYFSSQTQYSTGTKKEIADFFFCWSELGYNISKNIFGGFAAQLTRQNGLDEFQPGFVAGVIFKNITIPVYAFSPFRTDCSVIIGLNYEFEFKRKR